MAIRWPTASRSANGWRPRGVDALHVSLGSLFPHPLNPPGDFAFETITRNYDAMLSGGTRTLRNYFLFRYRVLRPIFYWIWFRQKWGKPVEGVGADSARAIKQAVNIPVICTGGWQTGSLIDGHIERGDFDAVSIARALLANHDLLRQLAATATTCPTGPARIATSAC